MPLRARTAAIVLVTLAALTLPGRANAFENNPTNGPNADGAYAAATATRCAEQTDRSFTGTLLGDDGMFVNATIGFDMVDADGNTKDLGTGCRANGYSTIVQLNHGISSEGAPEGTPITNPDGSRGVVGKTFTISHIPANLTKVWIEVYPRGLGDPNCGWPCAGLVDTHKYGGLNRRQVPLDGRTVDLRLPRTPAFGGTTGQLVIDVVNGSSPFTAPVKAYTWSMLDPEGSRPDQGWGFGNRDGSPSTWTFPSLGSGQDYRARFYLTDSGSRFVEVQHLFIKPGETTHYTFDVSKLDLTQAQATLDLKTLPAQAATATLVGRPSFACKVVPSGASVTFKCTLPKKVRKNTHVDVAYYAFGKWIRFTVKQVDARHRATLTGTMKYTGTLTWRVHVPGYSNTYTVVGT